MDGDISLGKMERTADGHCLRIHLQALDGGIGMDPVICLAPLFEEQILPDHADVAGNPALIVEPLLPVFHGFDDGQPASGGRGTGPHHVPPHIDGGQLAGQRGEKKHRRFFCPS